MYEAIHYTFDEIVCFKYINVSITYYVYYEQLIRNSRRLYIERFFKNKSQYLSLKWIFLTPVMIKSSIQIDMNIT